MGRQIVKVLRFPNSTWTEVTKYNHEENIWDIKYLKGCTQSWNVVIKSLDVVRNGLKWEIEDGTWIRVLDDP